MLDKAPQQINRKTIENQNKKHEQSREHLVPFSKYIQGVWIKNCKAYQVKSRTIVINLGSSVSIIRAHQNKKLHPRTSAILQNVTLQNANSLLLIKIDKGLDYGKVMLEPGWHQLGSIANYSKETPLFKSQQFELGLVQFDPYFVTGQSQISEQNRSKKYKLKVNLWYCPSKANCGLHNYHIKPNDFLQVHTQIYGIGWMQKYHDNDFTTLYEDKVLGPGDTHEAFASLDKNGNFIYHWHQYYGETQCIWMANQYHVVSDQQLHFRIDKYQQIHIICFATIANIWLNNSPYNLQILY